MAHGRIVGAFTASHSPGIAGWPERADAEKARRVFDGYEEAARRIRDLAPDAIIGVSVEHFTNFHLGNLPAFAVGTADSYLGPVTPEMANFLKVPQHQYPGHAALGTHLYEFALEHEFDPALVEGGMTYDENFCTPFKYLDPDASIPMTPIIVNGVNPPWPTAKRCYDFGRMLRAAVEAQDIVERVVVVGTGGLSHWVGMPESGQVNEEFDREFLDRFAAGDPDRLASYTADQINEAGNGAHEIRTWLVAAGSVGTPFEVLCYEAVPEWLTGTSVTASLA